jgi:hypothetical protein
VSSTAAIALTITTTGRISLVLRVQTTLQTKILAETTVIPKCSLDSSPMLPTERRPTPATAELQQTPELVSSRCAPERSYQRANVVSGGAEHEYRSSDWYRLPPAEDFRLYSDIKADWSYGSADSTPYVNKNSMCQWDVTGGHITGGW